MEPFRTARRRPTVKQLCIAAGTSATELFPAHPAECKRAQLYGFCDKTCPHKHTKLPDEDISAVINILQPAFDNPKKVFATKV